MSPYRRAIRTRHGGRLLEGRVVLSRMRSRPGPTHDVQDVLAACVATLTQGPRVAILGFGGGGMIAPLRAMGFAAAVTAIDVREDGLHLFRRLSRNWAGEIDITQDNAVSWLRRRRGRFDAIVEDLSVPDPDGPTKPRDSWRVLPGLMSERLRDGGVAVLDLLPVSGLAWTRLVGEAARPFDRAAVVSIEGLENRVVLAASELPPASRISRALRAALAGIGSRLGSRVSVRTVRGLN